MAQWYRAFVALLEDIGLVPNTLVWWVTTECNSSTHLPPHTPASFLHVDGHIHMHTCKILQMFKEKLFLKPA